MRIFISADIEGVAGVVNAQQGTPGNPEYERARRLMTQEVFRGHDHKLFANGIKNFLFTLDDFDL